VRFLELKIPPPIVGLVLAIAMWNALPLPPPWPVDPSLSRTIAIALAALGLACDALGLVAFLRRRTTINPLAPTRSCVLVTSGIYRLTRNPMYLGMSLLLLAWALWLDTMWGLVGPIAFALYITRFQIRPEERVLEQKFGDAFRAYASRVRRWI